MPQQRTNRRRIPDNNLNFYKKPWPGVRVIANRVVLARSVRVFAVNKNVASYS